MCVGALGAMELPFKGVWLLGDAYVYNGCFRSDTNISG